MGKLSSMIRSRLYLIGHTDVENNNVNVNAPNSHVDDDSPPSTPMRAKRRHHHRHHHAVVGYVVRNGGYIFFVCVFVLFMRAGFMAGNNNNGGVYPPSSSSATWEHPITKLMDEAEGAYRAKLGRQSRTLKGAVGEYRKRYGRAPPRGFDGWWRFAEENGVRFVDEYDGLVGDLAPFWEMSGEELRRRVGKVSRLPSIDVVRIKDGEASTLRLSSFEDEEVSARANGFRDMISDFAHILPDMDFPINAKAEGRVLVPWEHRKYPNLTHDDNDVPFRADWGTDGTVWEAWRRTCHPASPARRLFSSLHNVFTSHSKNYLSPSPPSSQDFVFTPTTSAHTLDFCASPHEHNTQGHFFSDWRTLSALYPVFSPARARGFMDIRIPSHYYYGSTPRYTYGWDAVNLELRETDRMEVPWARKEDKVFWRGATTGGGSHPPGFAMQYQRHRFIRMASDNSSTPRTLTFALPPSPTRTRTSPSTPHYTTTALPLSTLNALIMDTAFTKALAPPPPSSSSPALRFSSAVPLGTHWAYKYLVDLDGMGYSGRFMAFLASDSVPVKATVYEEFFGEWIQPWLHFIPLSHTYNEIYNIYAYFSGVPRGALGNDTLQDAQATEGDRRLRRIARAGKEWKRSVGRKVDMQVYVYRLALEWARLCADDRDAMGFEG